MFKVVALLLVHAASAGLMVFVFDFHIAVACAVLAVATLVFWIGAPPPVQDADTQTPAEPLDGPPTTSMAGP